MSLVLTMQADIGKYTFRSLSEVRISRSRSELAATASITLPSEYDSQYLCNVLQGGDRVSIRLGYEGYGIREEFTGYVVDVSQRRPVVIECEDEMYQLKRQHPKAKSWRKVKLAEVLRYLVPEAQLDEVPDVTLSPFAVKGGGSVFDAIEELCSKYGLEAFYQGGKLHVMVPYTDMKAGTARYDLEQNVIRPDLTFRREGDVRIKINAVSILPSNKKLRIDVGDSDAASVTTLHFYNVTTEAELRRLAQDKLKTMKYDGFSGSITTFGIPYAEPGMTAEIRDRRFSGNRYGRYMIDAVTTTAGRGGFRREVKIGRALSNEQK